LRLKYAALPAIKALVWVFLGLGALPALAQRNPLKAVSPATRQLLQKGEYAKALVELDQRLSTDSLNTDLLALRAECLLNLPGDARATAALTDLNKALRVRPNTWLLLCERGMAFAKLRRYPESVADYTTALHQTPAQPLLLVQRGYSQLSANHLPEALQDLAQATSLAPNDRDGVLMLAIAQMVDGRFPEALRTCNTLVGKHNTYNLSYANRALVRQRLQDPAGARQDANEALRLAPTDSTTRLISAFIHEQAGETAAAQQKYAEVQAKAKDKANFFFERGDLYLQSGNLAAAETDWKEAARLGSLDAAARLAAGFKPRSN
jgi:tetratricopeptide (TPR) repeat protein